MRLTLLVRLSCRGQNKNKTVVAFFCWLAIVGLHREILYTFVPAGHIRCQVDGFFRLIKQRYRHSNCDTATFGRCSNII